MTTTTISVRGDRAYVSRLKKLAALRNIDMCDLTRNALDSKLGEELAKLDEFLLTSTLAHTEDYSDTAKPRA